MARSKDKAVTAAGRWTSAAAVGFAFLHVLIWSALSFQYYRVENQPPDLIGSLFAFLFSLGHFFTFGLLFLILLLLMRLFLRRRSLAGLPAAILGGAATFLLVGDLIVYTLFRLHLSPSLVGIFFDASPFEIYDPPPSFYLMLLAALGLVGLMEFFLWRAAQTSFVARLNFKLGLILLLALISSNLVHAMAVFKSYTPVLARAGALPYAFPLSAKKHLAALGFTQVRSPEVGDEEMALRTGIDYPKAEIRVSPGPEPLNVIIVLLDSWRVESLNETVMPRLFERSKQALIFENHFSGGNATRCGVFSMFYGLPASYFHAINANRLEPVLMEKFRESGYDFGLYSSAGLTSVDIAQTSFVKMNDKLVRAKGAGTPDKDADMERNFIEYLKKRDKSKPFFGFVFYDLLHGKKPFPDLEHPFQPSKPWNYLEFSNDTDPLPYLNAYNNAAYTLDIHVDGLLSEMEALGLFENSVIIITGDHGEEVNDSRTNSWGHNSNFTRHQLQVPMLVYWPGRQAEKRSYLTRHYDLAATIMEEILGADPAAAPDYTLGVNLFEDRGRELTIGSSYSDNAILYDGNVFVLKKYGRLKTYSFEGAPTEALIPPRILHQAMEEMQYFYKD